MSANPSGNRSRNSTKNGIDSLESASTFAALDEETKSRMRDEARREAEQHGGSVTSTLIYTLYLAKRI